MVEKRLEESRVALQHLEMQLINVACDDPGEQHCCSSSNVHASLGARASREDWPCSCGCAPDQLQYHLAVWLVCSAVLTPSLR